MSIKCPKYKTPFFNPSVKHITIDSPLWKSVKQIKASALAQGPNWVWDKTEFYVIFPFTKFV